LIHYSLSILRQSAQVLQPQYPITGASGQCCGSGNEAKARSTTCAPATATGRVQLLHQPSTTVQSYLAGSAQVLQPQYPITGASGQCCGSGNEAKARGTTCAPATATGRIQLPHQPSTTVQSYLAGSAQVLQPQYPITGASGQCCGSGNEAKARGTTCAPATATEWSAGMLQRNDGCSS